VLVRDLPTTLPTTAETPAPPQAKTPHSFQKEESGCTPGPVMSPGSPELQPPSRFNIPLGLSRLSSCSLLSPTSNTVSVQVITEPDLQQSQQQQQQQELIQSRLLAGVRGRLANGERSPGSTAARSQRLSQRNTGASRTPVKTPIRTPVEEPPPWEVFSRRGSGRATPKKAKTPQEPAKPDSASMGLRTPARSGSVTPKAVRRNQTWQDSPPAAKQSHLKSGRNTPKQIDPLEVGHGGDQPMMHNSKSVPTLGEVPLAQVPRLRYSRAQEDRTVFSRQVSSRTQEDGTDVLRQGNVSSKEPVPFRELFSSRLEESRLQQVSKPPSAQVTARSMKSEPDLATIIERELGAKTSIGSLQRSSTLGLVAESEDEEEDFILGAFVARSGTSSGRSTKSKSGLAKQDAATYASAVEAGAKAAAHLGRATGNASSVAAAEPEKRLSKVKTEETLSPAPDNQRALRRSNSEKASIAATENQRTLSRAKAEQTSITEKLTVIHPKSAQSSKIQMRSFSPQRICFSQRSLPTMCQRCQSEIM